MDAILGYSWFVILNYYIKLLWFVQDQYYNKPVHCSNVTGYPSGFV